VRHHLGKRAARHGAIKMQLGAYLTPSELPKPSPVFGHYGRGVGLPWGMLGNDKCGCCVWAGAAHETMVWTHKSGGGIPAMFSENSVLADYSAQTGYNPADPNTDTGTDMQAAASYRRRVGVLDAAGARHRVQAYAALRRGDAAQLALAAYLFGAVGVGLQLPSYAEQRFDAWRPWVPEHADNGIAGGHYVSVVGRNSAGDFLVVTWGRLHAMSPAFYSTYSDEAVAFLTAENLTNNVSPEGLNVAQLREDLAALTGEAAHE
jgi:hypothetical protein